MDPKEPLPAREPLGLYVHVPFCPLACDFCAFYQERPYRRDILAFLEGVKAERALYAPWPKVDTLYLGGGTPGALSTRDLEDLGEALLEVLEEPPAEWTVELAPSTVQAEKVRMLKDLGVTRISLGVQSFDEDLLALLGRPHPPKRARRAFETIRACGFENINLDLIFAVPGQTGEMLERDLEQAIRLEPEHLSTYCLTYEEDTPLFRRLAAGQAARDEEVEADLYLKTWEVLEAAGYAQYEISNFSRPGFQCLHNLHTWEMCAWIGLGPSAASQYRGQRFANPSGLEAWLEGVRSGNPARVGEIRLTARLLAEDAILFGLRMRQGIRPASIAERFGPIDLSFLDPFWRDLEGEGLLERIPPDRVSLTTKGRLLADRIAVEVMAAFE